MEHLLPLLREGPEEVQACAADALRRLAAIEDCRLQMAGACIPTLLSLLCSPLLDAQLSSAGMSRTLMHHGLYHTELEIPTLALHANHWG